MKRIFVILITIFSVTNLSAAEKITIEANKFYFGGGIGFNSISGLALDDALGFQLFAGYELPVDMGDGTLSVEVGYMDSGNFEPKFAGFGNVSVDAKGIWSTAVVDVPINKNINLVGRAGLDFGDDDGLMIGGGVGFPINQKMDIRAEYVIRDNIDSIQFNFLVRQ